MLFSLSKNCRKGIALKYGGIKNVTETPIAVAVCLILGVKFLSEGRNVSLLDGCKRYCGTKINNEIYNCSDVPWRVATYKQKIRATFPIVRIFFMKRFVISS